MSTLSVVMSSILRILILPLSLALRMESIRSRVYLPYGISVMAMVLRSIFSMRARTLTLPPRLPCRYLLQSANPPVGKSG